MELHSSALGSPLPPPAEQLVVLRERALELARDNAAEAPVDLMDLVQFSMGQEHYALEAEYVREVWKLKDYTPLPGTPAWMRGVVNLRSQVVAILDIRQFFQLPPATMANDSQLLILAGEGCQFAIPVDSIQGAIQLPIEQIQSGVGREENLFQGWDRGVTTDRLTVLDGEKLLLDEKLVLDSGQV